VDTVLTEQQRETVLANIPLVEHIVNRVAAGLPSTYCRDDLVQTGIVGLIAATVRFDPEAGTAFSTFAGKRIEGAIIDMLRKADWAPRSVRFLERQLNRAELDSATGGAVSSTERLLQEFGLDKRQLDQLRNDIEKARVDSLDRPVAGDGAATPLSATVHDQAASLEEILDEQELIGYLRQGVVLLPERHRVVIVGYFFEGRSMTELGALLGVTQSRASQLKEEALKLLRSGLAEVYRSDGDSPADLGASNRQKAFTESFTSASSWRDRLTAGKGISFVG
jgi:RNA polymerase sigma factor for flagellar operon FliA